MTLEDLKKIQTIGTEILFNVVDICEKHNIQYFLMYGTLIGAVRHNGPIPWDDDVDIGMTRENYMRFLEVAPKELESRNEITIMGSGDPEYLSELKIGRKGTKYYLEGTQDLNIMHQIQLDVFLVDYIKNLSPFKAKLFEKIRNVLMIAKLNWDEKKLIIRCAKDSKRRGKVVYITGLVGLHLLRILFGEKRIEKWIYKMFVDKNRSSEKMGVAMLSDPLLSLPAKAFDETTVLPYDGRQVSVPKGYHDILRVMYGDYMQCPPEDKRYKNRFEQYVVEITE